MKEDLKTTIERLSQHGFKVMFIDNQDSAKNVILDLIPKNTIVGIGDSTTIRQIGIIEDLHNRGTNIINPFTGNFRRDIAVKSLLADIYLTSANAITHDGKIIDIDGAGNRIAGTIFGPEKVILVIGKNKIVKDANEAFQRIKNVIAPQHAKGMGYSLPCTLKGKCVDCESKERICRIEVVIERKPIYTEIVILLINEDLGLSWDPNWPPERINKIQTEYGNYVWSPLIKK